MALESDRVFICPHCERPNSAHIKGSAVWDGVNRDGERVDPPAEWTLVQCRGCLMPSVQLREDYGGGFEGDDPIIVFPEPRRLNPQIPIALRREWEEAKICFDAKAYAACAVMTRRTLEGTCKELGVKEPILAKALKTLQKEGLIDGMLAEWAKALRLAGNRGAHFTGEEVSREDAENALSFTEALLDHVYVLRKRFEDFMEGLGK
jgi:hypothetical protein